MTQHKKLCRRSASRYLGVTMKVLTTLEENGLIKHINIPTRKGRRIILHQKNWLDTFLKKHSVKAV